MDSNEFGYFRRILNKTQEQMGHLLGTSIKAVHSYEQGWRKVPPHVERQVFLLTTRIRKKGTPQKPCWVIKKCPDERKKRCPAWEFQSGDLCWFINGTICEGNIQESWGKKMEICRSCEVLGGLLDEL